MKPVLIIIICSIFIFSCKKFERPENDQATSTYEQDESHYKGQNCMDCHYSEGNGEGWFSVAGSAFGNTKFADIELYLDTSSSEILKIQFDQLGNAYTTEKVDFSNGLFAATRSANGELNFMEDKIFNGQCNLCHGTSIEGQLEIE